MIAPGPVDNPAAPLRLFILAGEPSGDRIAADLVSRLKARVPLALAGVGGDELQAQGLRSLFPMADLAVMGISDVLRRLPLLLWRLHQAARAILAAKPDVVVLVDSQDFSRLLAQRLKKFGYAGKLVLYVAPSVWARAPQRAAKLAPLFDEVLAVLPFEPAVMHRLGGPPTSYAGHPALAERLARSDVDRGPLVLLPGSRDGELRRHMPVLRDVAVASSGHPSVSEVVIPTLPMLRARLAGEVARWPVPVRVIAAREARAAVYQQAVLAVAVSGTVTLELALAHVPMVVSYVMDRHQAGAYERLGHPMVSLPNIVLGRMVVPELVQFPADAQTLVQKTLSLLGDRQGRHDQITAFGALADIMDRGEPDDPRQDPADRILAHWTKISAR